MMIGRTVFLCVAALIPMAVGDAAAKPFRLPDTQLLPATFEMLNGWASDDHVQALETFRKSCEPILRRAKTAARVKPIERALRDPCSRVVLYRTPVSGTIARGFFEQNFRPVRISKVGEAEGFITGYYEPEIEGSRKPREGFAVPFYRRPPELRSRAPRTAKVKGPSRAASGKKTQAGTRRAGRIVPYHDRAAIEDGALAGRGLEIGWAADPADLFFLQIQGSGRLQLPDGGVMRIGYAGQNGREYVAIGRLLRDRGILQTPVSMQAIRAWMAANPDGARALMRENPSYVFFRELTGPGPLGALELPVTPRVSIAADPRFVPLGAPVILSGMDDPRADGLWIAQDTGGAIRGANRVDTFWGAGAEAAAIAGGMQARGRALVLLPRGALERISARAAADR